MTTRASDDGARTSGLPDLGLEVAYSGVGVAVLAFALTRLFVAPTLEPDFASLVVAGAIPFAVGLGLTLYGAGVAVGAVSRDYARTVWHWSLLGTGAVLAILAATGLHSVLAGAGLEAITDAPVLVGNALLGGCLAGATVGHRIARGRSRETELGKYAERAMLVNRLLRHDVLNAATVVKGYAGQLVDGGAERDGDAREADREADRETAAVIRRAAVDVEDRVSRIKEFVSRDARIAATPVDDAVDEAVERALEGTEARLVDADDTDGAAAGGAASSGGTAADGAAAGAVDGSRDQRAATDGAGVELRVERSLPEGTFVRADERLGLLLRELLENAIEHAGPGAAVTLRAVAHEHDVVLSVSDDGPGLSERIVEPLARPGLPEQVDARLGYGLQMVRLLVDHYDALLSFDTGGDGRRDGVDGRREGVDSRRGGVESGREGNQSGRSEDEDGDTVESADASDAIAASGDERADTGTSVSVTLHRTTTDASVAGPGVPISDCYRAGIAALVAGVAMGLLLEGVTGAVPTIGQLYAVDSATVGWITHLFHSALFGLVVAAVLEAPAFEDWADSARRYVLVATAFGVLLWAVAAGAIMPLWLRAVDARATFPNLTLGGLLAHVVWGALLGWLYWSLPRPGELPVLADLPLLGRLAGGE